MYHTVTDLTQTSLKIRIIEMQPLRLKRYKTLKHYTALTWHQAKHA